MTHRWKIAFSLALLTLGGCTSDSASSSQSSSASSAATARSSNCGVNTVYADDSTSTRSASQR